MSAVTVHLPRFDPGAQRLFDHPYEVFAEYRKADPVHWGVASMRNLDGSWYLFRYEENAEVLSNAEIFANDPATAGHESSVPEVFRPIATVFQRWLGGRDGFDHKRLRSVLAKAFTPRRIAALRPRVEEITNSLIETAVERGAGTFDIVQDLSFPLPMSVVGDALGVKREDWHLFQNWAGDIAIALDKTSDPVAAAAGATAMRGMVDYVQELVARRRVEPKDDLLSAMVTEADDEGTAMSELDVIAIATELGFAGHETLTNGIGKAVLGMMEQRDRWVELGTLTGDALDKAIDELLRWTSPVQKQRWRWATADTVLGDRKIKHGQSVVSVLAAANRDPNHFPDPDRIDFQRTSGRHMTFGLGNHFCIGSQLARFEMRSALGSLATRFPNLRLTVDPKDIHWKHDFALPGPETVPVAI
jgi:cytochrome P450